jgi:hypothetical protein
VIVSVRGLLAPPCRVKLNRAEVRVQRELARGLSSPRPVTGWVRSWKGHARGITKKRLARQPRYLNVPGHGEVVVGLLMFILILIGG